MIVDTNEKIFLCVTCLALAWQHLGFGGHSWTWNVDLSVELPYDEVVKSYHLMDSLYSNIETHA